MNMFLCATCHGILHILVIIYIFKLLLKVLKALKYFHNYHKKVCKYLCTNIYYVLIMKCFEIGNNLHVNNIESFHKNSFLSEKDSNGHRKRVQITNSFQVE